MQIDLFELVPYTGIERPEYILKNGKAFNVYGAYKYILNQQEIISNLESELYIAKLKIIELTK